MRVDTYPGSLTDSGFRRYDLAERLSVAASDVRLAALVAEFRALPLDEHSPTSGRYRRYSQGVLLPWTGEFHWLPSTSSRTATAEYFQGEHNPEFPGMVRSIPALTPAIRQNSLLLELIQFDFGETQWSVPDSRWPLHVGVHFVKLSVGHDGEATSSPNELHQDGEPYTFAHLVFRHNTEGGGNVIATPAFRGAQPEQVPADQILAEFELKTPLDSYGIADHKVSHYVAPIRRASAATPAERAVILVDFSVMTQRI